MNFLWKRVRGGIVNKLTRRHFHLVGQKGGALEQARGRLVLVSAFFVFCYIIVVARAADVSIYSGCFFRAIGRWECNL